MLKKANRLRSRRDFKRALGGRRLCANRCFVLYGLPVKTSGPDARFSVPVRVGFIVSKKVHKRSVRRNRVKRQLRELARHVLLSAFQGRVAPYGVLVVIARQGALECPFSELKQKMEHCLKVMNI